MKTMLKKFQARIFCAVALGIGSFFSLAAAAEDSADKDCLKTSEGRVTRVPNRSRITEKFRDSCNSSLRTQGFEAVSDTAPAKISPPIPWSQIGAKARADYKGDGLAVIPSGEGARLRCVFQRLEGEATREGLWLTSTVTNAVNDRFRVTATEMGRFGLRQSSGAFEADPKRQRTAAVQGAVTLPRNGAVSIDGPTVRFSRPGLTEEYTVSVDGVRQDFIIEHPPLNPQLSTLNQRAGELVVRLAVSGAKVEPAAGGARLVLENSGRKIAYSRLRVTDATGKELSARLEVASGILPDVEGAHLAARFFGADFLTASLPDTPESAGLEAPALRQAGMPAATALAVLVNDADAVYPVRIDPTFSDANWMSMGGFPGAEGPIYAAVVDGSGNLYIGGGFTIVGDVIANNIAKWNGSSWSALGAGANDRVSALAVSGSNVYAGGLFTTAGGIPAANIAKWNGNSWSALGSGIEAAGIFPAVFALAVLGSDVYAGGDFTMAGGSAANRIAKWDGNSWSALGSGLNDFVFALAASGSNVYAGGYFTTAGGSAANYIAKWDGGSWSPLGAGMNSDVRALAASGNNVYAGGSFTTADGSPANRIAKWDGSSWSALGSGLNDFVFALAASGSDLYAGGYFTTAGGNVANRIARWDGSSWSALGSGIVGTVGALAASGNNVYAGGGFDLAGGSTAVNIAKWNGSSWAALPSGMNGPVFALAGSGTDLYVGGQFTTAGTIAAKYIAKWNGSSWSALGEGMSGVGGVFALAVSGSDLYAGGQFTMAGSSVATNIAKWNGNSWSALGAGMDYQVNALAVSGGDVYAGGAFNTAGGSAANYIAKWNGSTWSPLGSGMNGHVYALAVSGSDIYAGGAFNTAGGSAANCIAKWNGSSWSALGSGIEAPAGSFPAVFALAVLGSDVYAGGDFRMAGGSAANQIAKWNGNSWSALGAGMSANPSSIPFVYALAVSGGYLYAGGNFTSAGGSAANYIAKWDESSWSALGSGMNSAVFALAVLGSDVYAGGTFSTAGGKVSGSIARGYLPTLPTLSMLRSGTNVMVSWLSADTAGFTLEQAGTLVAPASWVMNAASVTDDGTNKSVTLPATNSAQFFRLRRP